VMENVRNNLLNNINSPSPTITFKQRKYIDYDVKLNFYNFLIFLFLRFSELFHGK
jgi:hypothetical protein